MTLKANLLRSVAYMCTSVHFNKVMLHPTSRRLDSGVIKLHSFHPRMHTYLREGRGGMGKGRGGQGKEGEGRGGEGRTTFRNVPAPLDCANLQTSDGRYLPWVCETSYLGIFVVKARSFRCSSSHSKRSFFGAINGVFGKLLNLASEVVILELVKSKCMLANTVVWIRML